MCGIIGMLGKAAVANQIMEALRRLEYRGYDSAGVATLENGCIQRRRAAGKLRNLELCLSQAPLSGAIGIGHTRWATHGSPTETNAHPHATEKLAVVHNGIIENFRTLKSELQANGVRFETETDTEVVARLVTEENLAQASGYRDAVLASSAWSRAPSSYASTSTCVVMQPQCPPGTLTTSTLGPRWRRSFPSFSAAK